MATTWTNENSGTVATQGNNLEGESLTVTGAISAGSTVNGWTMSGSGLLEAPSTATHITIFSEMNCAEQVSFSTTFGTTNNKSLVNLADDGVTIQVGYLQAQKHLTSGQPGLHQGYLTLHRKDSDEFSYIKMYSSNNTASYLFVANDGTLRIHNAIPTSNSDGSAV